MKELAGLVPLYINYFHTHGEAGLPFLIRGQISSKVLLIEYKKLDPIPAEQMNELHLYAQELFPTAEDEQIMSVMKIVYTIGMLA